MDGSNCCLGTSRFQHAKRPMTSERPWQRAPARTGREHTQSLGTELQGGGVVGKGGDVQLQLTQSQHAIDAIDGLQWQWAITRRWAMGDGRWDGMAMGIAFYIHPHRALADIPAKRLHRNPSS